MKKKLGLLFAFSLSCSGLAQDGRQVFNEVSDGNFQAVTGKALSPPTEICSNGQGSSKFLDELILISFKNDPTCQKVSTGNKGGAAQGDETYAKSLAYSMAEEMCGNSELHQNFVKKELTDSDALGLQEFNGSKAGKTNTNNAAATYALLYSLGYRKSSGNFNQPRNPYSKVKSTGSKTETGLTQTSANSLNKFEKSPERNVLAQKIFKNYISNLSKMNSQQQMANFCLNDKLKGNQQTRLISNDSKKGGKKVDFDHEGRDLFELFKGKSGPCKDLKTNSQGEYVAKDDDKDPVVRCFNDLHKNCPGFSIKYGAAIARTNKQHYGGSLKPGSDGKDPPVPSCQLLFNSIVKDKEKICAEMGIKPGPDIDIGQGVEVRRAESVEVRKAEKVEIRRAELASAPQGVTPESRLNVTPPSNDPSGPNSGADKVSDSAPPSGSGSSGNPETTRNSSSRLPISSSDSEDPSSPGNFNSEIKSNPKFSALMSRKSVSDGLRDPSSRVNDIINNPTQNKCAKGVRQTLNAIFGKDPSYGDIGKGASINAKDYDEEVLSQWQTKDKKYRLISTSETPQNYDIRVYRPNGSCPKDGSLAEYGHIEIYIDGAWYSDHKQVGTMNGEDLGNGYKTLRSSCVSEASVYRLSDKNSSSSPDATNSSNASDTMGGPEPGLNISSNADTSSSANSQNAPEPRGPGPRLEISSNPDNSPNSNLKAISEEKVPLQPFYPNDSSSPDRRYVEEKNKNIEGEKKVGDLSSGDRELFERYKKLGGDPDAFQQAMCFLKSNEKTSFRTSATDYRNGIKIENQRYVTIMDLTKPSSQKRLFILDRQTGEVEVLQAGHGMGTSQKGNDSVWARNFSNSNGSNLTPSGFFITGNTYNSDKSWGVGMRLHGLQKGINENSFNRGVVLHGASYVPDDSVARDSDSVPLMSGNPAGRSHGCTVVNPIQVSNVMSKLASGKEGYNPTRGGALYYNFSPLEKSKGPSYCGDRSMVRV
jgi:hypothetical protein